MDFFDVVECGGHVLLCPSECVPKQADVNSYSPLEHSIGKMVAAVLLAGCRMQLFEWERGKLKSEKLLQLVEGAHVLSAGGYVTLKDAAELTGLGCLILLRAVTTNR